MFEHMVALCCQELIMDHSNLYKWWSIPLGSLNGTNSLKCTILYNGGVDGLSLANSDV